MKRLSLILFVALAGFLALGNSRAQAVTVLDLTDGTLSGFIDSALFSLTDQTGSGSGNIKAFVQIDGGVVEEAYNTTVNNVFDNKSDDTHNHEIILASVPLVTIGGIDYREFLLDIGEPGDADKKLLSLDEIQLFVSDTANQFVGTKTGGIVDLAANPPVPLYQLDAGGDHAILLDSTLAGGQGQQDMFAYVPDSLFPGAGTQFVYLYSRFGEQPGAINEGSFEEWAVRVVDNPPCEQTRTCGGNGGTVPEPSSLLLMGSGFLGAFRFRSFRKLRA